MTDPLDLDRRTGWPADLRAYLERHPREIWPGHANLGVLARFWLDRHAMFGELATALHRAAEELREGKVEASAFQPWFVPRMRFLLGELDGHHRIEDLHYFPVFAAAEPRLAQGFAVLENDHETIHRAIGELAQASTGLLAALREPVPEPARAVERLAVVLPGFLKRLQRHLLDEEDLVIPLILERTEVGLGVG